MSTVEVFQEPDGRWRWEYRDEHVDLKSNRTYGDRDAAMHAARIAYPDRFEDGSRRSGQGSGGGLVQVLAIVLVIVVWRRRRAASP
jgi:hypothetical protein